MELIQRHDLARPIERLVEHGFRHAALVVTVGTAGFDESFSEEELHGSNVLFGNRAVKLARLMVPRVAFRVVDQCASEAVGALEFRCHNERTDLVGRLPLADHVNYSRTDAVYFEYEHVLFEGEESNTIMAAIDVCIEDALGVGIVVTAVVGIEGVVHEGGDPFEVTSFRIADQDI